MFSDELRHQLTTSIVNAVHPSRIILFGSYAYGTADEESDLDILVVEEKVISRMEEMRKVRKALVNIPLSKDIIVCDEEYFNSHSTPEWVNTALYDASKKGVVLYEKKKRLKTAPKHSTISLFMCDTEEFLRAAEALQRFTGNYIESVETGLSNN